MKMIPALCGAVLALFTMLAHSATPEVGVNYDLLPIPVEPLDPNRIEVLEVFSYGCPHCFEFESTIEAWRARQPADVQFRRLPAVFRSDWAILAQAFYAAEALGVTNKVNRPIFEAIHLKGLNPALDPSVLAGVFKDAAGVDGEAFLKVLNSFGVRSKVQQADAQGRMYRLSGVPALIVAGKYVVNSQGLAGVGSDRMAVVDYLVEKERSARTQIQGAHGP